MNWRYTVKVFNIEGEGTEAFEAFLLQMGHDRWELVTAIERKTGILLIFKVQAL